MVAVTAEAMAAAVAAAVEAAEEEIEGLRSFQFQVSRQVRLQT
jgi:hypothetical protein